MSGRASAQAGGTAGSPGLRQVHLEADLVLEVDGPRGSGTATVTGRGDRLVVDVRSPRAVLAALPSQAGPAVGRTAARIARAARSAGVAVEVRVGGLTVVSTGPRGPRPGATVTAAAVLALLAALGVAAGIAAAVSAITGARRRIG